jgi:hypothetical protein
MIVETGGSKSFIPKQEAFPNYGVKVGGNVILSEVAYLTWKLGRTVHGKCLPDFRSVSEMVFL